MKTTNEDNLLLKRIGAKRDRAAFEQLYTKHKRKAYSLALHITGKQYLAEEVVQEAMLDVWLQADRFIPGNGRAWLLSVVAHKCLQLNQKKSRKDVALGSDQEHIHDQKEATTEKHCSDGEVAERLREMVKQLPVAERSLLAMYYMGGLSQVHIAKVTRTPQRTVSTQLKRILEKLRSGMLKAGLASAALLPKSIAESSEGVDANFFEIKEPSVESGVRLMQRVDKHLVAEKRGEGIPSPKFIFLGLGSVIVMMLFAGKWLKEKYSSDESLTSNTAAAVDNSARFQENKDERWSFPAPQERPFHYKWSFDKDPLEDGFLVIKNEWRGWRPAKGKRPAAQLTPIGITNAVGVALPVTFPNSTFRIRVIAELSRKPDLISGVSFCWVGPERSVASYRDWINTYTAPLGSRLEIDFFCLGSCFMNVVNTRLTGLREFDKNYPRRYLALVAHGVAIESIEIDEWKINQFPKAYRDPKAVFSRAMKKSGWVMTEKIFSLVPADKE